MRDFTVPYGKGSTSFCLPDEVEVEVVRPPEVAGAADPMGVVRAALEAPLGGAGLAELAGGREAPGRLTAAIAINDKTRPVPHEHLLPPLLAQLEALGLAPEAISLMIATGAHAPMLPVEFGRVVPAGVLARYPVFCHNADDEANLAHLGTTSRGTPVWANRRFLQAGLRLVVGNVEPHQFQGFSGGVKSAAIGLAGRETVNRNHALMLDPRAGLGRYADNPARQDVEEIGALMGVHFALNVVLNGRKEIVEAAAGEPRAVMEAAIPLSLRVSQVTVAKPFGLVIASAGGHPKDLNLYQAQKALAHAVPVTRDGGTVIVVAACSEGAGSRSYEAWMEGVESYGEVFARFEREGFRVGPHKAFLIARDAARVRAVLVSGMAPEQVQRLLLTPAASVEAALAMALPDLRERVRVGILPRASSTIPHLAVGAQHAALLHE